MKVENFKDQLPLANLEFFKEPDPIISLSLKAVDIRVKFQKCPVCREKNGDSVNSLKRRKMPRCPELLSIAH